MIYRIIRSFAVQRVVVAGLAFATSLTAAQYLGPELFGKTSLFLFLAKILLVANLGSVSGYIFCAYSEGLEEAEEKRYAAQYFTHLGLVSFIFLCVSPLLGPIYFCGAAAFAILLPFYAAEPVLRVRRQFAASLWPDLVLSGALLCALALFFGGSGSESVPIPLFLLTILVFLPLGYPVLRGRGVFPRLRDWREYISDTHSYFAFVRRGLPLYLATVGFVALQSVDRIFLERFHNASFFGVYMLAFQLANGGMLVLNAQTLVSAIDFGEALRDQTEMNRLFTRNLRIAVALALAGMSASVSGAWMIERYFLPQYGGLTLLTAIMNIGLSIYTASANVSGVAFFKEKQLPLTIGMLGLFFAALAVNVVVLLWEINPIVIVVSTSLLMAIYGAVAIMVSRAAVVSSEGIVES